MIDIAGHLEAIHRDVRTQEAASGKVVGVLLRRTYDAAIDDVWDAITDPVRVRQWFLPLSGDLTVGGTFRLEGNAGGEILRCAPPRLLRVTFGGPVSLVELRLADRGEETTALELEHTVGIEMAGSGAGALHVGPGWDGMLLALALHLPGEEAGDPVGAATSPEAREFSRRSVRAWAAAIEASGTASPAEIAAGTETAMALFAPEDG